MQYVIEDILDADFGCEERQEGAPLMCCLALLPVEKNVSTGGYPMSDDAGLYSGQGSQEQRIFRNIPDTLADELYLEKGQLLTEEELKCLAEGHKPDGWDALDHRNVYRTDIGLVCMSHAEYRMYREKKEELKKYPTGNCGTEERETGDAGHKDNSDLHMSIRKTQEKDLPEVFAIYDHARRFMRENGNPRQWGDKWPPEDLIREDVRRGKSYICEADGKIAATFYYDCGKNVEPGYMHIEDGKFTGPETYGVVHRIAVAGNGHGVGSFCINWAFQRSGGNLRMDTHPDNKVMQHTLKKTGFQYCGIIHVIEDDDPRYAYEKYDGRRTL